MEQLFQQIQKYEKGTNRVGASRLQAIASILDVPVSFFFDDARRGSRELLKVRLRRARRVLWSIFSTAPKAYSFHRAFARISNPAVRRKMIDLVKAIAGDTND